ncbi:MAG TPA: A24 family peptidase [Terriglobales bacterium]
MKSAVLVMVGCLAATAGGTDWRWRRIPNWLTVPGALLGLGMNSMASGWEGVKASLEGIALGLALLFPFIFIRAIGAGDWKLVGAIGAFLGPRQLLSVLLVAVMVAGVMAAVLIVYKKRIGESVRNIGRLLVALGTGHAGERSVSLDNPEALKVPFGVAVALAVVVFVVGRLAWGGAAWF